MGPADHVSRRLNWLYRGVFWGLPRGILRSLDYSADCFHRAMLPCIRLSPHTESYPLDCGYRRLCSIFTLWERMDKIMHDPYTQSLGRAVVDYTSGPSPEALKSKFNTVILYPTSSCASFSCTRVGKNLRPHQPSKYLCSHLRFRTGISVLWLPYPLKS